MNIIFFSPHFPQNCLEFCIYLRKNGANVLGIGDTPFDQLSTKLQNTLTDYIQIPQLENYEDVFKSVGLFIYRYGKIDRFESLNDYWLELEAKIRTDFNIYGTKLDTVYEVIHKSKMKMFFDQCDISKIRSVKDINLEKVEEFVQEVDYPIVIKPDHGSGASMTSKIMNHDELVQFFNDKRDFGAFIAEEFIDGHIFTYDGLVDRDGQVLFDASHFFDQNIMTVVNSNDHLHYYCLKEVPENVRQAGMSILKIFGIKERFFHIELFKSLKNGKLYGLEVNMRPPGAWMTDSINYTYDINIYEEWANLVVLNRVDCNREGKYFTAYASRKKHKNYVYNHDDILHSYSSQLVQHNLIEDVFSQAMGNYAYQFRAETFEEVEGITAFVQEEKRD